MNFTPLGDRRAWLKTVIGPMCSLGLLSGCQLLMTDPQKMAADPRDFQLPPIMPARDTIQIEVLFAERPLGDPLLGKVLWNDVDQVGALPIATRQSLRDNGIRVGHVGSNPPQSLQTLLGWSPEIGAHRDEDSAQLTGRRIAIRSGGETQVLTSDPLPRCDLVLVQDGKRIEREYEDCRFMFHVKPQRLQTGWVQLEMTPEIHFGSNVLRPKATSEGWQLKGGQKVESVPEHCFRLTLNVGEFGLLTAAGDDPTSLGHRLFHVEREGRLVQRLLIIRLASTGTTDDNIFAAK